MALVWELKGGMITWINGELTDRVRLRLWLRVRIRLRLGGEGGGSALVATLDSALVATLDSAHSRKVQFSWIRHHTQTPLRPLLCAIKLHKMSSRGTKQCEAALTLMPPARQYPLTYEFCLHPGMCY